MLRITTGTAKNKRLVAPTTPDFRAVQEVAKQALFSIVGDKVVGSVCLDLFAGSGNLGLEALSRGATWCDFVDENYDAIGAIIKNIANCGFVSCSETHRTAAVKYVVNTEKKYDIIFADPYYKDTSHIYLFKHLEEILNENGVIALFHGAELPVDKLILGTNITVVTQRRFGKSYLTIGKIKK